MVTNFSSLIASSGSNPAVAAFTRLTFLLKVENLNLVSDLSSYLSCLGLKVLSEALRLNILTFDYRNKTGEI